MLITCVIKDKAKFYPQELTLIAWYPKRWCNFCISEDEKREIKPIFTIMLQCASV